MSTVDFRQRWLLWLAVLGTLSASGCVSWRAIPVNKLPPSLLARPRSDKQPIDFSRLEQDPPANYILMPRDILGIYVEGVLGPPDQPPPVHFSENAKTPPAIGYPIPIGEDGMIELPLLPSVKVSGLTLSQASQLIRQKYTTEFQILQPGKDRTIVTLIRKRSYSVLVIREDSGSGGGVSAGANAVGQTKRGSATPVDLEAYENDVLHALGLSGGLPGLDAKNEIVIIRRSFNDKQQRSSILRQLQSGSTTNCPQLTPDAVSGALGITMDDRNVTRIPLRIGPNDPPVKLSENDVILNTGDIVFIQTREREMFYTGGLLPGREILIPRDYDLDVLGALALAGQGIGTSAGTGSSSGGGFGGGGSSLTNIRGLVPPTQVIIVRKINGNQVPIKVRTCRAVKDPAERILIKPGDLIMLEYTPVEMIANIALNNISLNYFLNPGGISGSNNSGS